MVFAVIGSVAAISAICFLVPGGGDKLDPDILKVPVRSSEQEGAENQMGGVMSLPFDLVGGEKRLGSLEAKVHIIAFIPSAGHGGCGNETATVLHSIQQANPDELYVHVVDFDSQVGVQLQTQMQTSCAGLLINGQQRLTVDQPDGEPLELNFKDNLGDLYDLDSLWLALDHEFGKAYGTPAARPAFDDALEPKGPAEGAESADNAPDAATPGEDVPAT